MTSLERQLSAESSWIIGDAEKHNQTVDGTSTAWFEKVSLTNVKSNTETVRNVCLFWRLDWMRLVRMPVKHLLVFPSHPNNSRTEVRIHRINLGKPGGSLNSKWTSHCYQWRMSQESWSRSDLLVQIRLICLHLFTCNQLISKVFQGILHFFIWERLKSFFMNSFICSLFWS